MPGSTWGGAQRKVPRLTHSRMSAYLDEMLVCDQNWRYLQNPCLTPDEEATTLPEERRQELAKEDQVFYDRYAQQFYQRWPSRKVEETWITVANTTRFDV